MLERNPISRHLFEIGLRPTIHIYTKYFNMNNRLPILHFHGIHTLFFRKITLYVTIYQWHHCLLSDRLMQEVHSCGVRSSADPCRPSVLFLLEKKQQLTYKTRNNERHAITTLLLGSQNHINGNGEYLTCRRKFCTLNLLRIYVKI